MLLSSETFARYHRMGFSPRPIRGKIKDQDLAVAYYFDDVQYVLNDYAAFEDEGVISDMDLAVQNLTHIVNSDRHFKIKSVLEHIQSQMKVPLWVEIALDPQLGVTFGCADGSLAEMILDFPSVEKFEEYKERILEQLKSLGADIDKMPPIEDVKDFIVIPTNSEYDVIFKDMKVDGVIVEIMDDDDDYYIEIDLNGDDDDDDEDD